ncbi:MAG: hypothetical protein AAF519_17490 [Bacteroidota bacterium]
MAKKKKIKKQNKNQMPNTEKGQDSERDFGGFPDRDLKKNLGCG